MQVPRLTGSGPGGLGRFCGHDNAGAGLLQLAAECVGGRTVADDRRHVGDMPAAHMRRPAELAGIGHEIGLTAVRQDRLAGRDLLFVDVEQRAVGIDAGKAAGPDL